MAKIGKIKWVAHQGHAAACPYGEMYSRVAAIQSMDRKYFGNTIHE